MDARAIEVGSTQTRVVRSEVGNLKHVAIYGYSPGQLAVQVRAHGQIHDHGHAVYRSYSVGFCNLQQARAVRDAIDLWIAEQDEIADRRGRGGETDEERHARESLKP